MKKVLFIIFLLTNLIILGCARINIGPYLQAEKDYEDGNYAQAFQGFKKACETQSFTPVYFTSCGYVAQLYFEGKGVEQDYKEAVKIWEKLCNKGSENSCNNLGISYKRGLGVKQDYKKALKLFEKACDKKSAKGE